MFYRDFCKGKKCSLQRGGRGGRGPRGGGWEPHRRSLAVVSDAGSPWGCAQGRARDPPGGLGSTVRRAPGDGEPVSGRAALTPCLAPCRCVAIQRRYQADDRAAAEPLLAAVLEVRQPLLPPGEAPPPAPRAPPTLCPLRPAHPPAPSRLPLGQRGSMCLRLGEGLPAVTGHPPRGGSPQVTELGREGGLAPQTLGSPEGVAPTLGPPRQPGGRAAGWSSPD